MVVARGEEVHNRNYFRAIGLPQQCYRIGDAIHAQVTSKPERDLLARAIELEKRKDYAGAEEIYKQALRASSQISLRS